MLLTLVEVLTSVGDGPALVSLNLRLRHNL
jgi:hypothetical protein